MTPPSGNTTFAVPSAVHAITRGFFNPVFPMFVTSSETQATSQLRFVNYQIPPNPTTRDFAHNPWLASDQSLSDFVEVMSAAMTDAVRFSNGSEQISGTILEHKSFVNARWVWLSLPLMSHLSSLLFLVQTILQSRNTGRVWKNSALAVMLHGLERKGWDLHKEAPCLEDARSRSRDMMVQCACENHELSLV